MKTPIALISGATAGIGEALAYSFAEAGCNLALCARTEEDLSKLAQQLQTSFPAIEVLYQVVDVCETSDIASFANAIHTKWGRLTILINNAGIFLPGSLLTEPVGQFEKTIETNVYSVYYMTRAMIPLLTSHEEHSHIFNMCSIASITAYPSGGSYAVSKWALLGYTRCLREELKDSKIRVTAVLPGATWSRSWEGAEFPKDRLMQPADIASTILAAWELPPNATVEEVVIRPQKGDI